MKAKITFPAKSSAPLTGEHIVQFKGGIEKKKNTAAAILALSAELSVTPTEIESSGFEIEFLKSEVVKKPEKQTKNNSAANGAPPSKPSILDPYTLDPHRAVPPLAKDLKPGTTWVRRNTRGTITLEMLPALHPNGSGQVMPDNEAASFKGIYWDFVAASGERQIEAHPATPAQNIASKSPA
jgi:hypothetical protein